MNIVGGVIVVVEKTADARELCKLCCEGNHPEAATVIESPNDFNLSLGECPLGEAESYDMCLRKGCPEADICPLMLASRDKQKSPIIIMLPARYTYFMDDMSSFSKWQDEDGICHSRNLLLIWYYLLKRVRSQILNDGIFKGHLFLYCRINKS